MFRVAAEVILLVGTIGSMSTGAEYLPGPPPTFEIGHRVIDEDETPGRFELGGGEQAHLWIDKWRDIDLLKCEDGTYRKVHDSMGDVVWESSGAGDVFPIVGAWTVLTAGFTEKDEAGFVHATVFDSGTKGVDPPVVKSLGPNLPEQQPAKPQNGRAETKMKLSNALWATDRLRHGRETPFAEVERRIAGLLKQYPAPKDQGQIYYEAAHVYAQTGLIRPQAAVDYAKKALQLPVEPVQRIRLYGYWGGTVFMLKRTDQFPQRRLAAVIVFLDGLAELRKFNLPEKAPERPAMGANYDDAPTEIEARRMEEQNRREAAAWEQARFLEQMIQYRDAMIGQIVWLYSREPNATEELRQLTVKTTRDPELAGRLVKAVGAENQSHQRTVNLTARRCCSRNRRGSSRRSRRRKDRSSR